MWIGLLAFVAASFFASAALYMSAVEHPARLGLDDAAALRHWKPSYARGARMQGLLALAAGGFGLAAFATTGDPPWLAGALLMLANLPYTMLVIMPTNRSLGAIAPGVPGSDPRPLLLRWGTLHAVRTALGLAATGLFAYALS